MYHSRQNLNLIFSFWVLVVSSEGESWEAMVVEQETDAVIESRDLKMRCSERVAAVVKMEQAQRRRVPVGMMKVTQLEGAVTDVRA